MFATVWTVDCVTLAHKYEYGDEREREREREREQPQLSFLRFLRFLLGSLAERGLKPCRAVSRMRKKRRRNTPSKKNCTQNEFGEKMVYEKKEREKTTKKC